MSNEAAWNPFALKVLANFCDAENVSRQWYCRSPVHDWQNEYKDTHLDGAKNQSASSTVVLASKWPRAAET